MQLCIVVILSHKEVEIMKAKLKIIGLVIMVCIGTYLTPQQASAQGPSVSFQVFYDELSPYGYWVISPDYGYVWVPNVDPGFTPYATNGYWVYTDMGWTWVSNYSWGWAPFHYGRWYADPNYGYMWVPDNEWSPGWVTWRRAGGYYGWAPIGPGVSINVAYGNSYMVPYNQWTFVSDGYLGRTNINNYYVNNSNNVVIIKNSTVINNTRIDNSRHVTYHAGPDRIEVEKHVGRPITPVIIRDGSRPGQTVSNNQIQIYRPHVQKNVSTGPKPAPAKAVSMKTTGTSPQHSAQPARQQPAQEQHSAQPAKQQPAQQQHSTQPAKQQPAQQQHSTQPAKQQPAQQQHSTQPAKQQPAQQQHSTQPVKKEQTKPQQGKEPDKVENEKQSEQHKPK
jgi:hypothetical protein